MEAMEKNDDVLEDEADGIIVKYCTGMLIKWEGIVNLKLSYLKIGTGTISDKGIEMGRTFWECVKP